MSKSKTQYGRVRSSPETEARGLAGRIGFFVGETRPSSSGMPVVGVATDDYALALYFEELEDEFWFPPDLIDLVNADGSPFVRQNADDSSSPRRKYVDVSLAPRSPPDETPVTRFLAWLEQFLPRLG